MEEVRSAFEPWVRQIVDMLNHARPEEPVRLETFDLRISPSPWHPLGEKTNFHIDGGYYTILVPLHGLGTAYTRDPSYLDTTLTRKAQENDPNILLVQPGRVLVITNDSRANETGATATVHARPVTQAPRVLLVIRARRPFSP